MTGGKVGKQNDYLKPFGDRRKTTQNYIVYKDEKSMQQRMGRCVGMASLRLEENLLIVSGQRPEVRSFDFQHFRGSTVGSLIGPVIMPPYSSCWNLKWEVKERLFGPDNFVSSSKTCK